MRRKFLRIGSTRRLASMARIRGSANDGASRALTHLPKVKDMMVSRVNDLKA